MKSILQIAIIVIGVSYCKSNETYYIAKGTLAARDIEVRVDSYSAKKLLESNNDSVSIDIPEYDRLKKLTDKFSIDYSSIYLLKSIYKNKEKLEAQKKYVNHTERLLKNAKLNSVEIQKLSKFKFVFIPGLAYKLDTSTGADFQNQRKWFSNHQIQNDLIETDELGLTEENAMIIKRYIDSYRGNQKIILISASKGGLDVIYYLDKLANQNDYKKIFSWINVGGILRGTLIAEQHCDFPKSIVPATLLMTRGKSLELVGNIRRDKNRSQFTDLQFTKYIKVIHLIGIPFRSQVREEVLARYLTLAKYGPNDGLTLISDTIFPRGIIITEIGLDHFFKDKNIDLKTAAIALLVTESE